MAVIPWFEGTFDGSGCVISNLHIQGGGDLGLFGRLSSRARISNLGLENVDVDGTSDFIGGLAGQNSGSIAMSYSNGVVNGKEHVGGFVGSNSGEITTSYSASVVNGLFQAIGGLVGSNYRSISTSSCTGTIHGEMVVGGFAGINKGIITNSYSICSVSGERRVGGFTGSNGYFSELGLGSKFSSIVNCYSAGPVNGANYVGGFVGDNALGEAVNCFWNIEISGQIDSPMGIGKTTAEMQDVSTFLIAGWDAVDEISNGTCDYWEISPGRYPELHYHFGVGPVMPEGAGTIKQPYLIRDAQDLGSVWFRPMAHYRLDESIDLSGITWSGAVVPWFGGTFDGNDHIISRLSVKGSSFSGFFGTLGFGGVVFDLGLEVVDVNGTDHDTGGLAGVNEGSIAHSYVSGIVKGDSASFYGLFPVGGLVGHNRGTIGTSCSMAMVSGDYEVGGFVGLNNGSVGTSYSTGTVSGGSHVGGLVGQNLGDIDECYSTGTVSGHTHVGGLVGRNPGGSMTYCYSTGAVSGNNAIGGLLGRNGSGSYYDPTGIVIQCFWDTQASGQITSSDGIGRTTAEMQTASTFLDVGWDFVDETANGTEDIWWIDEGKDYPRLWWELIPEN